MMKIERHFHFEFNKSDSKHTDTTTTHSNSLVTCICIEWIMHHRYQNGVQCTVSLGAFEWMLW